MIAISKQYVYQMLLLVDIWLFSAQILVSVSLKVNVLQLLELMIVDL